MEGLVATGLIGISLGALIGSTVIVEYLFSLPGMGTLVVTAASEGDFPMVQVPRQFRGIEVVTPRFLRAAHRHGIRVQVWTVNEAEDMQALLDMGVDGVMTDRPSLLKQILIDRGEWRNHA